MAGSKERKQATRVEGASVAIIEARYYQHINDQLIAGIRSRLAEAGCEIDHIEVAGALEIPAAIALCHENRCYDGYVAVGCVIRGETTHYELVAGESSRGLTDLAVTQRALIGNAILTVENEHQAIVRADPTDQDKGGHAADAVIGLIALQRRLSVGK